MPAKKTFTSIRVRGVAQFDGPVSGIVSSAPSFKSYVALLTQSETNPPVATVLENTLAGEIIWSRIDVGTYRGTLAGAFPLEKTWLTPQGARPGGTNANIFINDEDTIQIEVADGDDYMSSPLSLEIRVYN